MTAIEFNTQLINLESSLNNFAFRFVLKQPEAQDLVQETFLKALICQTRYIDKENFKAWVFTIMKNTFIDSYRHSYKKNIYLDQTNESFFTNKTVNTSSYCPETAYSVQEIARNVENLPEGLRLPFKMYLDGYKYKEIADELNLNIGTVKSRIFLSRKQLMSKLKI